MASLCEFRLCENQQSWTQPSEFELKKRSCLSAYLSSTIASQMPIPPNICRSIVSIVSILLTKAIQVTCALYIKQPYHTSILSGEGSVQELLSGHLKHIQCELGSPKKSFISSFMNFKPWAIQDQNMCLWRNNWLLFSDRKSVV